MNWLQAVLSPYASARTTCMVMDSGVTRRAYPWRLRSASCNHASWFCRTWFFRVFYEGHALPHAILRLGPCRARFSKYLMKFTLRLLQSFVWTLQDVISLSAWWRFSPNVVSSFTTIAERDVVFDVKIKIGSDVKRKVCDIVVDFGIEIKEAGESPDTKQLVNCPMDTSSQSEVSVSDARRSSSSQIFGTLLHRWEFWHGDDAGRWEFGQGTDLWIARWKRHRCPQSEWHHARVHFPIFSDGGAHICGLLMEALIIIILWENDCAKNMHCILFLIFRVHHRPGYYMAGGTSTRRH